MPSFSPFAATRFNDPTADPDELSPGEVEGVMELDGVVIPYVAAADPRSHLEFAAEEVNRYNVSQLLLDEGNSTWRTWLDQGVLREDDGEQLYCYRIGYRDDENRLHQIAAAVGVFDGVAAPADQRPADIVPLVTTIDAPGFSDLLSPSGVPLARATDSAGVHHRLWSISQAGIIDTICDAVGRAAIDGRLAVQGGASKRLGMVAETWSAQGLPALGFVMRRRGDHQ